MLQLLARRRRFVEQLTKHNVAHRESERRHGNGTIAQVPDQVVVASAAGNGTEFSGAIENLEDDPGVIGEATNDSNIDIDELA